MTVTITAPEAGALQARRDERESLSTESAEARDPIAKRVTVRPAASVALMTVNADGLQATLESETQRERDGAVDPVLAKFER